MCDDNKSHIEDLLMLKANNNDCAGTQMLAKSLVNRNMKSCIEIAPV